MLARKYRIYLIGVTRFSIGSNCEGKEKCLGCLRDRGVPWKQVRYVGIIVTSHPIAR